MKVTLGFVLLGMSGCVGRIQEKVYLQWVPHLTADRLPDTGLAQVEVLTPRIPLFYDDYRLVYRTGTHRLVRSSTLLWYERPRAMLLDWLLGRVRDRSPLPEDARGRWVLGLYVDVLQVVLAPDRKRAAAVFWSGRIFMGPENEPPAHFLDFSEEEPVSAGAGSEGIAAAFVRLGDRAWVRFCGHSEMKQGGKGTGTEDGRKE